MAKAKNRQAWQTVKLGDVAHQVKRKISDPASEGITHYLPGGGIRNDSFSISEWQSVDDGVMGPAFHMYFSPGHTLYKSRVPHGVGVADRKGICANTTYIIEANPEQLLSELLPFVLVTDDFRQFEKENNRGSTNLFLNYNQITEYEFLLPPLDEQRRIANLLWAVEDSISRYSDLLIATSKLAKSRLSSFIKKFDQKKNIYKVEDLLVDEPKNGYSPNANESGKGYRTVSISAISNGKFDPEGCIKFADVEYKQISSYFVQKDDVFVVRGNGNRYLAGKCGIAAESFKDMFYPDLLIRLRFDNSKIFPAFATMQWNDPFVHLDFISRAKSTNGIWKVNGQDVRKHTLVVPPLGEQEKFLTEDNVYKSAIKNLEDCYEQVSKIKSQLLNNYLTG